MSMLKSDQQGFLIGEVLDVSKEMLSGQRAGLEVLSRIDANVSAMLGRGARQVRSRQGGRSISEPSIPAVVPTQRTTGARIAAAGPIARAPRETTQAVARAIPAAAAAVAAATAMRDSRGRFVKAGGTPGSQGKSTGSGGGRGDSPAPDEAFSGGENRIVEAIKETAAQSTDRMDPMIEAAKEVWEPMGRGWRASFGQNAEKKKERWYKRIWQSLNKKTGESQAAATSFSNESSGMLSGIAAGIAGRLAGLVGMVPLILGKVFAPVAAAWAALEVGQWIGGKIHDWLVASGLQDKLFAWVDSMRAGWTSMMDRLGHLWDDNIGKPAKKAVAASVDIAGRVYEGGIDLIKSAGTTFADGAAATNSWIHDKTGFDVGATAKNVATTAGGALGALIGRHEGDYDSFNRGRAGDSRGKSIDFSSMTVGEIMEAQSRAKTDPKRLFAVGKYQVIPKTLKAAVDSLGISKGEFFTPELQERIFKDYLIGKKRPAVAAYISGESDDIKAAALQLSQEFASVTNPYTGVGYYDGQAGNKALISVDKTYSALRAMRATAVSSAAPTLSVPSLKSMSLVSPIGSAPDIAFPSMSGAEQPSIKISIPDQVGQNVSDRSIAHITTGGLGAS